MELKSVFVTGANRGIGFEFVRQLVDLPKPPKYVFATYRSKDKNQALEELARTISKTKVILIQMDVTDLEAVKAAAKRVEDTVGDEGLTLLINNAGLAQHQGFPNITPEMLNLHFNTNTVGPIVVFQELLPSLKKAAKAHPGPGLSASRAAVLNISAGAGSIGDIDKQPKIILSVPSYTTSKAALNMAMRVAACTVKDDGVLVLSICPGWVKTDMGSNMAFLTPQDSIAAMLRTLAAADDRLHGLLIDKDGKVLNF